MVELKEIGGIDYIPSYNGKFFSAKSTLGTSVSSAYSYRIEVTLKSQDVASNTSTLTLKGQLYSKNWIYSDCSAETFTLTQNGAIELSKAVPSFTTQGSWVTVIEKNITVTHDNYGVGSTKIGSSISGYISDEYCPWAGAISEEDIVLPNIDRACKFTLSQTVLYESSPATPATITITNPINSVVYATMTYSASSTKELLSKQQIAAKGGKILYIQYDQAIAALNKTTGGGDITLTLSTYSDSACKTLIGEKTATLVLSGTTIPLSLYDNNSGSIGVTIGAEASGSGFVENLPATFNSTANFKSSVSIKADTGNNTNVCDYVKYRGTEVTKDDEGNQITWYYRKYVSGDIEAWANLPNISGKITVTLPSGFPTNYFITGTCIGQEALMYDLSFVVLKKSKGSFICRAAWGNGSFATSGITGNVYVYGRA